ncbi:MAG: hypothetical protein H0T08_09085 [Acidobacteria bacterium]|jgi:hypothetical protein|nr:hypothetical protein [Acidobacteriota bacterium]
MKMKYIAAIAAFTATFFLSVLLIGLPKTNFLSRHQCNIKVRHTVTSLLEQDIAFGDKRDAQTNSLYLSIGSAELTYTSNEYAEIVTEYVRKSESMNDSTLPPDFRLAWRNHMKAWREHMDFLDVAKESFFTRNSEGEFFKVFEHQDQEITNTWRKVEFFGRKYGANNLRY